MARLALTILQILAYRRRAGALDKGLPRGRRIERAFALRGRGDLSLTEVRFAVGCSSPGTASSHFAEGA